MASQFDLDELRRELAKVLSMFYGGAPVSDRLNEITKRFVEAWLSRNAKP